MTEQQPPSPAPDFTSQPGGPWAILNVTRGATDEQIRLAYLEQVRLHPPEREPEQFEQIRDAYNQLRDPRQRAKLVLDGPGPQGVLERLLKRAKPNRSFVGPEPWLAALKEKRP